MYWLTPPSRYLCALFLLSFAFVEPALPANAGNELEQNLRSQYRDKILVLRGFYQGERLAYDSSGNGSGTSGDWTVDGFVRVTALSLSEQRLTIKAERLAIGATTKGFQFQRNREQENAKNQKQLDIEIVVDPGRITNEGAEAALSRIFLTNRDRLEDLVPFFWKPCVLAASTGKSKKPYSLCSFSQEVAAVPGVLSSKLGSEAGRAVEGEANAADNAITNFGKGMTPPKVIFQNEPPFSEEARQAKFQGTAVLLFRVDKTGNVRNVRILVPLGYGLDEKAVKAVSTWRFEPGKKDGEPIDAEIAVEVDFHLD